MSWSQHGSSSFSNSGIISEEGESLANNAIYVTHNYDISGNDKIDNGINIVLREYGGFNGIRCKVDKSGGNGVAKALVLETTNPKDDVALEATGRVRFYNVRDIANEDAIYNLQLYARSIGNGNFELLAKQV